MLDDRIAAEAIFNMLSDAQIQTAEIRIPVRDGEIPAYGARPADEGGYPVVLLAPEIFGLNENMRDICRRFAREGYYAIAPDLFSRQGDVSKMTDHQEMVNVVSKVPDGQAIADLDAAADFAAASGGDITRLYMTGFCWGGRIAWLYAAESSRLRAAVAWYGRLVGETDDIHTRHPLGIIENLHCPVLGLYGGMDKGIPLDTVEAMRAAIANTQKNSDIHVYPEAGHGFFADFRPSYNPAAAEDGWHRMLEWFGEPTPPVR
jgi:carboxymethylenebutenolidase